MTAKPHGKQAIATKKGVLLPNVDIGPPVYQYSQDFDKLQTLLQQHLRERGLILSSANASDQGSIESSEPGHVLISQGDEILIDLKHAAPAGSTFIIYRPIKPLTDPQTGEEMGMLAENLGTAQISGARVRHQWQAHIISARQEIHVGDRLLHNRPINFDFTAASYREITIPGHPIHGRVLHISDNREMAGSYQVIVVGVGRREKAVQGMSLTISKHDSTPPPTPPLTPPRPPQLQQADSHPEPQHTAQAIADATLFQIGEKASFALLGVTRQPVSRGDYFSSR